jgi:hypothetical protein
MIGQVRLPNGTILVLGDDLKWTVRGEKDDWLAGQLNAYQSPRQCDQGPAFGSPAVQALLRVAGIFGVQAEIDVETVALLLRLRPPSNDADPPVVI